MHSIQSSAFRNRWLSLIPNCSWFNFSRCVCVKDCNSERNSSTSLRRCSKLCWFFTSITSLLASNLGRVRVTWLVDISGHLVDSTHLSSFVAKHVSWPQRILWCGPGKAWRGARLWFGVFRRILSKQTSSLCPCALPWLVADQGYEFGFQWRTCQTEVFKNENV